MWWSWRAERAPTQCQGHLLSPSKVVFVTFGAVLCLSRWEQVTPELGAGPRAPCSPFLPPSTRWEIPAPAAPPELSHLLKTRLCEGLQTSHRIIKGGKALQDHRLQALTSLLGLLLSAPCPLITAEGLIRAESSGKGIYIPEESTAFPV